MNYLAENDDGAGDLNFRIEIDLEAGENYYLSVWFNYHYTEEGAYTLHVERVENAA